VSAIPAAPVSDLDIPSCASFPGSWGPYWTDTLQQWSLRLRGHFVQETWRDFADAFNLHAAHPSRHPTAARNGIATMGAVAGEVARMVRFEPPAPDGTRAARGGAATLRLRSTRALDHGRLSRSAWARNSEPPRLSSQLRSCWASCLWRPAHRKARAARRQRSDPMRRSDSAPDSVSPREPERSLPAPPSSPGSLGNKPRCRGSARASASGRLPRGHAPAASETRSRPRMPTTKAAWMASWQRPRSSCYRMAAPWPAAWSGSRSPATKRRSARSERRACSAHSFLR